MAVAKVRSHVTSFVGRAEDLADLRATLEQNRLVTVTGPGGIGKSRLVDRILATAEDATVAHLEGARDAAGVVATVASALGVSERSAGGLRRDVRAHLADSTLLLVLDPCEHVLDATADLVDELLVAAPRLRVLAVSRQPLGLESEAVRRVRPLPVEDAVRLLIERSRLVRPAFVENFDQQRAEELCRRLDGAPLAIELAAARLEVLSSDEILERLSRRFELLRRGEQSLLATVEWSYGLLEEEERALFRRLSVFRETFDLEAAEVVAGADLDRLQALVAKSLVQVVDGTTPTRFRLLDMLRDFASLRLVEEGDVEPLMERLAAWIAGLVLDAYPPAMTTTAYVHRLAGHHADLTAALEWTARQKPDLLARMAGYAWYYFFNAGRPGEGYRWMERACALEVSDPELRGRILVGTGGLATAQGLLDEAAGYLLEAIQIADRHRDIQGGRRARANYGLCLWRLGRHQEAVACIEESIAISRATDQPSMLGIGLINLAVMATHLGDHEGAEARLEEALAVPGQWTDRQGVLVVRAEIRRRQNRLRAAAELLAEAAADCRRDSTPLGVWNLMTQAAAVAADQGRPEVAVQLAVAARRALPGEPTASMINRDREDAVARARATLGARAEAVLKAGRGLSDEQALDLIGTLAAPPEPRGDGPLTSRQLEVARLVAGGLTNREIGERLFLTERGAEGHVERIRHRLGVRSRSEIASWVTEMGYRN